MIDDILDNSFQAALDSYACLDRPSNASRGPETSRTRRDLTNVAMDTYHYITYDVRSIYMHVQTSICTIVIFRGTVCFAYY